MKKKELCLLWQNQLTRQWYHVANLIYLKNGAYMFSYENDKEKRGLKEALKNGYHLHPAFPDREKEYYSRKLFSTFARRLPNKSRKDYTALLELNNLSVDSDEFEILSATGGRLISDNYEFVRPIQMEKNQFFIDFYVRGWRHYNSEDRVISDLEKVYLEVDENNPKDIDAVAVKDDRGIIGFVPAFYSEFVKKALTTGSDYRINNIVFDGKAASHNKVRIFISGEVEENLLHHENLNLLLTV